MPNNIRNINQKFSALKQFLERDALVIIGNEAVNFAQENFQHEGFQDESIEKWPEVKRRDKSSNWYGFQYGASSARPGKTKRNPNSVTNYSPAATKRKILTGSTGNLGDSFYFITKFRGVTISNRMPYAGVQNDGGNIKVFGKRSAKLKSRKMIGKSRTLERNIQKALQPRIRQILLS